MGTKVLFLCRTHHREFGGSAEEYQQILERLQDSGVDLLRLPGRISSPGPMLLLPKLRHAIRTWRPDIVHAQENEDPRLLALTRGYPSVITIHDPVPHLGAPTLGMPSRAVDWFWLRSVDRVVVHGESLRRYLNGRVPAQRVGVIPHGTDVSARPLPRPGEPAVLLFGRLERYKGIHVLLQAMEMLWSTRPEVKLLVFGRGSEAHLLTGDRRIENATGYFPEGELTEILSRASVVALPYLTGTQSGVGVQAIGHGVPVVVSDVGALAELTPDGSFVVPPGDSRRLAAALLAHIDDGDARKKVLDHAKRHFAWSVTATRSLELYATVLAEQKPAA